MGKETIAETDLSRAQFFSYLYKKGLEVGTNVVGKFIDSYKEFSGSSEWTKLTAANELTEVPKLFIRKTKGIVVVPFQAGKIKAFLANCPDDHFLMHFDAGRLILQCPICQKAFYLGNSGQEGEGISGLVELPVRVADGYLSVMLSA
ncbi:hypothetical protein [Thermincola potens]|uniref:Rieske domain-containing protein n=1 Tax=Thermincola potens (strain JR) TaxID=635013 RepID=D5X9S2_THEPJ|nr:hypothetical protein [Thermincola potens]ADG81143.1 hypothetical protein TherJR_0256 [Thermincola potens JR]